MCSHRSPRGDRRCLKEESVPLFVLFVLFGQAKRTLKEKNHKESFPLSYFSMTKRRVQGGEATSGRRRRDRGRVLKERGTLSLMTFGTFGHAKVR